MTDCEKTKLKYKIGVQIRNCTHLPEGGYILDFYDFVYYVPPSGIEVVDFEEDGRFVPTTKAREHECLNSFPIGRTWYRDL